MSIADGSQLREATFQVANVNKALGSVSKMARNGNRVVFDASGSYTENKVTNDKLWLRERDGVGYVADMMVTSNSRKRLQKRGGACSRACKSK